MKYLLMFSFTNSNVYSDVITIENNKVWFKDKVIFNIHENDNLIGKLLDYFAYDEWDKLFWISIQGKHGTIPTLINMDKVDFVELVEYEND